MIYIHFHFKGNTNPQDKSEILRLLKFTTDEIGFLMHDGKYLLDQDGELVLEHEVLALIGNKNGMGYMAITDLSYFESNDDIECEVK